MIVDNNNRQLSLKRQCELLELARSSLYYRSIRDDTYNEQFMRLIDEQYTKTPFYGIRRMTAWLQIQGHEVNHKRVARLMGLMGLEAVYPKPKLSVPAQGHKTFPYLLRGVEIAHPDQVWSADITYIRMSRGFMYLVAIMDWFSRYVLAWELSITLDADFCVAALERALTISTPEIFNSDQGAQFTSEAFIKVLLDRGIRISMDGKGRALDNIFVERLWRSVKYEEVYLHDYRHTQEGRCGIGSYFRFYNEERPHQSLGYRTPLEVYAGGRRKRLINILTKPSIHLYHANFLS
jgi:putative transposase